MSKFIGSKKIRSIFDDPDDDNGVLITFKDDSKIKLKRKLYECIVRDAKGNGEHTIDVANSYIAMKFVKELADYGYERYQIEGVATAIGNIVHNLTEEAIGKKFGVASSLNVKISDIL